MQQNLAAVDLNLVLLGQPLAAQSEMPPVLQTVQPVPMLVNPILD